MSSSIHSLKRSRDDSDISVVSPEAKRIRDDLFDILDDTEINTETEDLDSVMKSFAEEISMPSEKSAPASDSGESQPELGYLLEASDDELGLPPAVSEDEKKGYQEESGDGDLSLAVSPVGLDEIWGFDDEIQGYDFGIGEGNGNGEVLALDGLFDYSDVFCAGQQTEFSDYSWRHESLPAL